MPGHHALLHAPCVYSLPPEGRESRRYMIAAAYAGDEPGSQRGDVYATGHREDKLASLDPRMTSLEARIVSGKSQNVNKTAATAAICRGSRWLVMSAITGGINGCIVSSRMHICAAAGPARAAAGPA